MIWFHFRARGINSEWVFGRKGLAKRSKKSDQWSFRMLNQFAVEIPTLPVEQCQSHLIQFLKELQAVFFGMPSHREGPPGICDTHGTSKTFSANSVSSCSAPYPQELNQWNSSIEEPFHWPTVEKSEKGKTRSRSEMPVWTVSQKFKQTNNDCRFPIFILTNSLHQPHLLAGR